MNFFGTGGDQRWYSRFRFSLGGTWTTLTAFLVAACVIVFVFAYGNRTSPRESSFLMSVLRVDYASIRAGEVWRLPGAPFLHVGMLQLLFGCAGLYFFGGYAARRLRLRWFVITYVACGAAGALAASFAAWRVAGSAVSFEGAPGAVCGVIFICTLYFPYMQFLGRLSARPFGWILMGAILLSSIGSGDAHALAYLAQLAALPVAYAIYRIEPAVEWMRSKRRLRREIIGAFTEAQHEEQLDQLLQKVAREGMDSLSRKERHFLRAVSKEYRRRKVKNNG